MYSCVCFRRLTDANEDGKGAKFHYEYYSSVCFAILPHQTMKKLSILLALLLLVGCEDVWTAEVCNDMFAETLEQIDGQKETVATMRKTMEEAQRKGNTKLYDEQKKIYDEYMKEGIGGNIAYIEDQVLKNCDHGVLRSELFPGLDAAKKFLTGQDETFEAEGMPDIQVTKVDSTFIPYELDDRGECSGPYLDLKITVLNRGSDFPRPIDLKIYEERAKQPADKLSFFTVSGELNFGGDSRKSIELEVKGGSGGRIPSSSSLTLPMKIKIDNDQVNAHVTAKVTAMQLLKNGYGGSVYETNIDVPLWDIYTESHIALTGKDEGKPYFGAMAVVTNKGKSPTPGPIQGSFVLNDLETGLRVTSWSGKTEGPVSDSAKIVVKEPFTGTLPKKLKIQSILIPLCPDGKTGNLADGDVKNNARELIVQASEQQAIDAAVEMQYQEKMQ